MPARIKCRAWDTFQPGDKVKINKEDVIGIVLPPDKKFAKKVFYQPECKVGDYGVTVWDYQYILVDITKELNPTREYGIGKQYFPMHQIRRIKNVSLRKTNKSKRDI